MCMNFKQRLAYNRKQRLIEESMSDSDSKRIESVNDKLIGYFRNLEKVLYVRVPGTKLQLKLTCAANQDEWVADLYYCKGLLQGFCTDEEHKEYHTKKQHCSKCSRHVLAKNAILHCTFDELSENFLPTLYIWHHALATGEPESGEDEDPVALYISADGITDIVPWNPQLKSDLQQVTYWISAATHAVFPYQDDEGDDHVELCVLTLDKELQALDPFLVFVKAALLLRMN